MKIDNHMLQYFRGKSLLFADADGATKFAELEKV